MLLFFVFALFVEQKYRLFAANGAFMFFMLTITVYFWGQYRNILKKRTKKLEKNRQSN
jgi:F0F1-type ATP synthase membrane subunit b/b'